MKRLIAVLLVLALGALIAFRVVGAIQERGNLVVAEEPPPVVSVAQSVRADFPRFVHLSGTLKPKVQVDVHAKQGGRLLQVLADLGDRVEKNQVLAVIEHEEMKWQARQAQAAVEVASAQVAGARLEFERTKSLYDNGAVPVAALEGTQIKLELASAQLEQAKAAAGLAQVAVSNFTIRAPISGLISRRLAEQGAMAGPQLPLFTIQDSSSLELATTVSAADFVHLKVGQQARLQLDELPGEVFEAELSRLAPALDPMTRRAEVVLSLKPPAGEGAQLLVNAFAKASILVGIRENNLAVPVSAVVEGLGGQQSLLLFDGSTSSVKRLEPRFAEIHDGLVAVLPANDGEALPLEAGDEVVVEGHGRLVDGSRVVLGQSSSGSGVASTVKPSKNRGSEKQDSEEPGSGAQGQGQGGLGAAELGKGKLGAEGLGSGGLESGGLGSGGLGSGGLGSGEPGSEGPGAGELRAGELGSGELGSEALGAGALGAGELGSGALGAGP